MTKTGHNLASIWVKMYRKPRVGLVLSGGGARGLAHIGVIQVLQRAGIPVDCLAGTSMGGVIAAGYAAGMSSAELEQEAKVGTRLRHLLSLIDLGLPDGGLLRGQRLLAYFERQLGQRTFADLRLPLALVAVDLNTRREAVLCDGPVALALRATTAVPGLFAPVEMDGQRLVDGGLLNNLPVDVVLQMGAEVVIAVDVASPPEAGVIGCVRNYRWAPESLTHTLGVLDDAMGALSTAAQEGKRREYSPDVLIRPTLPPGVNLFAGYHRAADLIACGERAAEAALPELEAQWRQSWHWPVIPRIRERHITIGVTTRVSRPLAHQPGCRVTY